MAENIDDLISKEEQLKKYSGPDACIYSLDLLKAIEETPVPLIMLKSKIPKLDRHLRYFASGELVTISGPTKHGKTLFAQTLTRNFYQQGHGSLWFSYEVPAYQFLKQFGDDDPPIFIMPKKLEHDFKWIEERIWESKLKYNIAAVFIDNTHNLVNIAASNLTNLIRELLKTLTRIAIEYNVVVFLMHHLIKGKLNVGDEIGSHLLRDSSMVAQTSDTVMFIWRNEKSLNRSTIKITENRAFGVLNEYVDLVKIGNFLEEAEI